VFSVSLENLTWTRGHVISSHLEPPRSAAVSLPTMISGERA
jgi:hypothetical protein